MQKSPNYLNGKVCLNVLTNSVENSKEIYAAAEGYVLVGVLSKNYPTVDAAVEDMRLHAAVTENAISVGLGAGDPKQSQMVSEIAAVVQPQHVNQVFTGTGYTRALLGQDESVINGLISPTGTPGMVKVSTGPISSEAEAGIVPIGTAIEMMKDMHCNSVKFFPMGGLSTKDEYIAVAEACAAHDFMLEPTGGIDLDNFAEICQIAIDAGVKKIIPHVYTSIIDPVTKDTKVEDIKTLLAIMKTL